MASLDELIAFGDPEEDSEDETPDEGVLIRTRDHNDEEEEEEEEEEE
jgi:hypothetical protein